mmetsp:Transcript_35094/g.80037  ORF Transcript_35094/g.80037 Transcript_35094/m.80037 type:complete len:247 (+) Transcript_35094:372-1112(+)
MRLERDSSMRGGAAAMRHASCLFISTSWQTAARARAAARATTGVGLRSFFTSLVMPWCKLKPFLFAESSCTSWMMHSHTDSPSTGLSEPRSWLSAGTAPCDPANLLFASLSTQNTRRASTAITCTFSNGWESKFMIGRMASFSPTSCRRRAFSAKFRREPTASTKTISSSVRSCAASGAMTPDSSSLSQLSATTARCRRAPAAWVATIGSSLLHKVTSTSSAPCSGTRVRFASRAQRFRSAPADSR